MRCKLGSDSEGRPEGKQLRSLKPDLYQTFEFRATLPGPAELKVQLKDWNRFYPVHELIGETRLDLEDRWFHRSWQALDVQEENSRNKLKPIEVRGLKLEDDTKPRGQLHLWLEIRPEREVLREPPVPLSAPEVREFEVRVICWKTKDVPYDGRVEILPVGPDFATYFEKTTQAVQRGKKLVETVLVRSRSGRRPQVRGRRLLRGVLARVFAETLHGHSLALPVGKSVVELEGEDSRRAAVGVARTRPSQHPALGQGHY